jgi:hypothetical protein
MLLIAHVSTAIISIVYASYTVLSPSKLKLRITYFLTLATVLSGFVLALISSTSFGKTCLSGLVYIGAVIVLTISAKKRLLVVSKEG